MHEATQVAGDNPIAIPREDSCAVRELELSKTLMPDLVRLLKHANLSSNTPNLKGKERKLELIRRILRREYPPDAHIEDVREGAVDAQRGRADEDDDAGGGDDDDDADDDDEDKDDDSDDDDDDGERPEFVDDVYDAFEEDVWPEEIVTRNADQFEVRMSNGMSVVMTRTEILSVDAELLATFESANPVEVPGKRSRVATKKFDL